MWERRKQDDYCYRKLCGLYKLLLFVPTFSRHQSNYLQHKATVRMLYTTEMLSNSSLSYTISFAAVILHNFNIFVGTKVIKKWFFICSTIVPNRYPRPGFTGTRLTNILCGFRRLYASFWLLRKWLSGLIRAVDLKTMNWGMIDFWFLIFYFCDFTEESCEHFCVCICEAVICSIIFDFFCNSSQGQDHTIRMRSGKFHTRRHSTACYKILHIIEAITIHSLGFPI